MVNGARAVLALVAGLFLASGAAAQIHLGIGYLSIVQTITVHNATPIAVQFARVSQRCVSSSPATFTAPPNQSTTITVDWTYKDSGGDSCYTDHHNIAYADVTNPANAFRIQQYGSSGNYACVDIEYYLVFWINQAVCPEFSGNVTGPATNSDDNGVACPADTPWCPPYNGGDNNQFFGFVIRNPSAPCVDTTCLVTSAADDGSGSTLRAAIGYANAHDGTTITFAPALAGQTITLASELPLINGDNTTIDGGSLKLTISGGGKVRPFFIGDTGWFLTATARVTLANLTITDGLAAGGPGGSPGGGGGAGLGGAIFVSRTGNLTLDNVIIAGNSATGGAGGSAFTCAGGVCGGGGGGGLGGAGGANANVTRNGGGGGGGFGAGARGGDANSPGQGGLRGAFTAGQPPDFDTSGGVGAGPRGSAGGTAGGGGGGGSSTDGVNITNVTEGGGGGGGGAGGNPGTANDSPGSDPQPGAGGAGGFGGGGGGVGGATAASAGNGGYGGGGGGGWGNGGYGGGGGGGPYTGGSGGYSGGDGGSSAVGYGAGGGGAALGGAIFVQDGGSLSLQGGATISGNQIVAGAPGTGGGEPAEPGQAAGVGTFLAGNGTVTFAPPSGTIQTVADALVDQSGAGGRGNEGGAWTLVKTGGGTLALRGAHALSGGVSVRDGALALAPGATLAAAGAPVTVTGGILDLGGTTYRAGTIRVTGGTVQNGTLVADAVAAGSGTMHAALGGAAALVVSGPGTVTLTAANGHTGGTSITGGTLALRGGSLGSPGGDVAMTAGVLDLGGATVSVGTMRIDASGAPLLRIQNGTLAAARFTMNVDGTGSPPGNATVTATLAGSGALTKGGAGALTLTGANTYQGGTLVRRGALQVDGSITGQTTVASGGTLQGIGTVGPVTIETGGTLQPGRGSSGTQVLGSLALRPGAKLAVAVGPQEASGIATSGTATLGGTLDVTFLFPPERDLWKGHRDAFTLVKAASVTGTFDAVVLHRLPPGITATLHYAPSTVTLRVVPAQAALPVGLLPAHR